MCDKKGAYELPAVRQGVITVEAQAPLMKFEVLRSIAVKPSMATLPDIPLYKYALCGNVLLGLLPPALKNTIAFSRRVELKRAPSGTVVEARA